MRKLILLLLTVPLLAFGQAANKTIPVTQKAAANGVATLDGSTKVPAAQIPTLSFTKTDHTPVAISASSIDFTLGDVRTKTLSADTTFTFANAASVPGKWITIMLTNTASNYLVTWPTVKWVNNVVPVMTIGAKTDIYGLMYDGTNYWGSYSQNY